MTIPPTASYTSFAREFPLLDCGKTSWFTAFVPGILRISECKWIEIILLVIRVAYVCMRSVLRWFVCRRVDVLA